MASLRAALQQDVDAPVEVLAEAAERCLLGGPGLTTGSSGREGTVAAL
jgi:hypothetical protein